MHETISAIATSPIRIGGGQMTSWAVAERWESVNPDLGCPRSGDLHWKLPDLTSVKSYLLRLMYMQTQDNF